MIKCPICSILTDAGSNWFMTHLLEYHTKMELIDVIVKAYSNKEKEAEAERVMEWNEWAAEMANEKK